MMKKKALYILGSIVVVLGGLLFGGQAWLKGRFQKDALVQQIESEWNCRAELDSSTISLFSSPAKVELKGLRMAPRDGEVEKALARRAPLDPKTVEASIDHTELSVELWDLIHGKVNIKKLRFEGLGLRGEVDDDGKSSLRTLFSSPDKTPRVVKVGPEKDQNLTVTAGDAHIKGVKVEDAEDKKPKKEDKDKGEPEKPEKKAEAKVAKEEKKGEPFKAGNMPVSLQVDEAGIYNGRVEISDRGHGTHTVMDRLRFELKDVDVNPADLAGHNLCKLAFDGVVKLTKDDSAASAANFDLNGTGKVKPFDADGELNPDLTLEVMLHKGSQLGGATIKESLRKKDAEKLNEYGIDLSDIALGGVLGEDVTTEVHTFNGKVIVKKDTKLVFPQYQITILEDSWFNSRADIHKVRAELVVAPELSARIWDLVKQKLTEKYTSIAADLADGLLKPVLFKEGRLVIPFRSSGSLSKPEPNFDNFLGEITDFFKDIKTKLLFGK